MSNQCGKSIRACLPFPRNRALGFVKVLMLLVTLGCSATASAQTGDLLAVGSFEEPSRGLGTDIDAARFLTQATFGPTRAEITRTRQMGYAAWIDEQLSLPATFTRPWLETLAANPNFSLNGGHRVDRWMTQALYAPDQLRQRMAFALSQILVVAETSAITPLFVAEYQDTLARGAFGNYRTLLGQVTFSTPMARWLTYLRTRAAYQFSGATIQPDENYAREIMQLFSFGLIKRNLDFTPTTNPPTPTYDNATISEMARVFTGLTYVGSDGFYSSGPANMQAPLTCLPMINPPGNTNFMDGGRTYHDNGAKTIFDGIVLPAVPNTQAGCISDINAALDAIFNHPTTAPNVSRQLIMRFTTSNPSPDYIRRVSTVFVDNGSGVRGDLGAVIRAILLDPEARRLPRGAEGKLREPLLRLTAAWRALNVEMGAPEPLIFQNGNPNTNGGNITTRMGFTFSEYGQRPLSSPTVFNFYVPDYQPPGALDAANLYAPEFQVLNENTVARMNNSIFDLAANRYQGLAGLAATSPRVRIDDLALPLATYSATTQAALVDELNVRLMYGFMSNEMRRVLLDMLAAYPTPTNDDNRRQRVRDLVRVIVASPEFSVQK
jgi:uncharacterized protein (DUF1800 family)